MGLGYQDAKAVSARECRERIGSGLRQSIIVAAIPGCAAKLRFWICRCVYIYVYMYIYIYIFMYTIHMYTYTYLHRYIYKFIFICTQEVSLQECCKHGA